jgi:hypothetical protein
MSLSIFNTCVKLYELCIARPLFYNILNIYMLQLFFYCLQMLELSMLGGRTYKEVVRAMMDAVLDHNMQCEINFSGLGLEEKAGFKCPSFKSTFLHVFKG